MPIQTKLLKTENGASANYSFTGISSKYTHLKLIGRLRTDRVAISDYILMSINGDTVDANYLTRAFGSTNNGGIAVNGTNKRYFAWGVGDSSPAGYFTKFVTWIYFYNDETYLKHVYTESYGQNTTDVFSERFWLCRHNVAAVSSIVLAPELGSNFVDGSYTQLYGVG